VDTIRHIESSDEAGQVAEAFGVTYQRQAGQTFSLAKDGRSIYCWNCRKASYSMGDVREKYCGGCSRYHTPAP
jgi:hypothetical protein